ncbi:hypothetical protein HOG48_01555 [Candidatus Peregrinibacteria bacterium]|nr:hypothetical protein [Candidatus Peregrinibacteria bacterium]
MNDTLKKTEKPLAEQVADIQYLIDRRLMTLDAVLALEWVPDEVKEALIERRRAIKNLKEEGAEETKTLPTIVSVKPDGRARVKEGRVFCLPTYSMRRGISNSIANLTIRRLRDMGIEPMEGYRFMSGPHEVKGYLAEKVAHLLPVNFNDKGRGKLIIDEQKIKVIATRAYARFKETDEDGFQERIEAAGINSIENAWGTIGTKMTEKVYKELDVDWLCPQYFSMRQQKGTIMLRVAEGKMLFCVWLKGLLDPTERRAVMALIRKHNRANSDDKIERIPHVIVFPNKKDRNNNVPVYEASKVMPFICKVRTKKGLRTPNI